MKTPAAQHQSLAQHPLTHLALTALVLLGAYALAKPATAQPVTGPTPSVQTTAQR